MNIEEAFVRFKEVERLLKVADNWFDNHKEDDHQFELAYSRMLELLKEGNELYNLLH